MAQELKAFEVTGKVLFGRFCTKKVYDKNEVDAVLAGKDAEFQTLKQKLMKYGDTNAFLTKENTDLKIITESKDAEIRRLQRALWLVRAERADDRARIFYFNDLETMLDIDGFSYDSKKKKGCKKLTARDWRITWLKVERKCRAKAEEYK